ncbi:hypothetical protein GM50_9660 [freshwater metagenome]|uniref:Uncharacterized protein n=1 Tax=freshwater metagenome TaxID=449393 RepID=A0A094Q3Z4_9ZZZZ
MHSKLRGRFHSSVVTFILSSMVFSIYAVSSPVHGADFTCINSPGDMGKLPRWSTSGEKNLSFVVSWAFKDPEQCIVGLFDEKDNPLNFYSNAFYWKESLVYSDQYRLPTNWTFTRQGEMVLISAETTFPIQLLESMKNRNLNGFGNDIPKATSIFGVQTSIKSKKYGTYNSYESLPIKANNSLSNLWGLWFSKNQGIFPSECSPIKISKLADIEVDVSSKILSSGPTADIEIRLRELNRCILLVHAGPMVSPSQLNRSSKLSSPVLSTYPFWDGEAPPFFEDILNKPDQLIQIGVGDYLRNIPKDACCVFTGAVFDKVPEVILNHSDSVMIDGNDVVVKSSVQGAGVSPNPNNYINVLIGIYVLTFSEQETVPNGWRVNFSGNSWTARYFQGGVTLGGWDIEYLTRVIKIPSMSLFLSAADKAAADKAAADKAALEKFIADVKADVDKAVAKLKAAETKKKTITCVKGKISKKVTGITPKCPSGYKQK